MGVKLTAGALSQVGTNQFQGFREVMDGRDRPRRQPFQAHYGLIVEMLAERIYQFSQMWAW
jgi:hypothetical protein